MLAAARQLSRALVGADGGAITAQCRNALTLGAADFSTKAGTHGRSKRSTPKPPLGGDDGGLPSLDDVPVDAMSAQEFQRRVEELAARSAQQPPSGSEEDTGLAALQEIHTQFEAAMAHVRNRAVMDHEEDRIDFLGKSSEEVESLKSQRRLERREKWGRWAAAFPEDADRLAADAEWPLQEIPKRAAEFYESLRDYEGMLEPSGDGQSQQ